MHPLAPIAPPIAPTTDDDPREASAEHERVENVARPYAPVGRGAVEDEGEATLAPPPPARSEVDTNIAERLSSYGKSQFRNHGGQGHERERDWELSPPSTPDDDDDERDTVVPYSDYSPVQK